MGNKLGRRRQVVDERYTKPQGLYVHKDVDHKKLRKLILESKLAPCYPGDEEFCYEQEECPICFLYYPSLNRSNCCMKGICTECFLQMKNPNSARPTQCPFCKTSNYAVEYRGVKTKEEKGLEQIEEQRVIEAKIRIRQQELQDEEERMQKKLEICSSSTNLTHGVVECSSSAAPCHRSPEVNEEINLSQQSYRRPPYSAANRPEEFDLDLEDIMIMEAIWLSIQENERKRRSPVCGSTCSSAQYAAEAHYTQPVMALPAESSSSPSGGLACAIAALAERQQMNGESSFSNHGNMSTVPMGPVNSSFNNRLGQGTGNYMPTQGSNHILTNCRLLEARQDADWCAARGSDAAEAGTSYASSDTADETTGISALLPPPPPPDDVGGSFHIVPTPLVPETFEEQMMLAMAVSLAEARAMPSTPRSAWQ